LHQTNEDCRTLAIFAKLLKKNLKSTPLRRELALLRIALLRVCGWVKRSRKVKENKDHSHYPRGKKQNLKGGRNRNQK
jgi:hypothetical protein